MVEHVQEHTIGASTEKMKEGAQEFTQAVKETAKNSFDEYCEQGASMIQSSPYKSVLIAFGIGAVLGMLMLRRD
ncbi:MAG TPA: DUF883 C-terminal domain-containing protein [Planctomycetota bacterium]|nr:DUF883 C-terminal domain-containing protein [Planctomycetota bacterium]